MRCCYSLQSKIAKKSTERETVRRTFEQKEQPLLERLVSYAGAIPQEQDYLKTFVRHLVENPGSLTVRDIGIVCGLTQTSPEELLELSLCWSEVDMALEMAELATAHKE